MDVLNGRRLKKAAIFSWRGLQATWRDEPAFRQELAVAVLLLPLAFWLTSDSVERALLVGTVLLVLVVEVLNTALEAAVDLVAQQNKHPLAAKAKDCGSAAVFLSILIAMVVWGVVLWPH
jgi:diacylglycerol kinase (ATP)